VLYLFKEWEHIGFILFFGLQTLKINYHIEMCSLVPLHYIQISLGFCILLVPLSHRSPLSSSFLWVRMRSAWVSGVLYAFTCTCNSAAGRGGYWTVSVSNTLPSSYEQCWMESKVQPIGICCWRQEQISNWWRHVILSTLTFWYVVLAVILFCKHF
jgi:hypothetical protein